MERGDQRLSYDFWWNIPHDYMISSEWGLPPQFENGLVGEDLLANRYGHRLHFWDLRARHHIQTIDLGANHQMTLEVRPAHEPTKDGPVPSALSWTPPIWEASIWTWWRESGQFKAKKTAVVPPQASRSRQAPRAPQAVQSGAAANQRHRLVA